MAHSGLPRSVVAGIGFFCVQVGIGHNISHFDSALCKTGALLFN